MYVWKPPTAPCNKPAAVFNRCIDINLKILSGFLYDGLIVYQVFDLVCHVLNPKLRISTNYKCRN